MTSSASTARSRIRWHGALLVTGSILLFDYFVIQSIKPNAMRGKQRSATTPSALSRSF